MRCKKRHICETVLDGWLVGFAGNALVSSFVKGLGVDRCKQ